MANRRQLRKRARALGGMAIARSRRDRRHVRRLLRHLRAAGVRIHWMGGLCPVQAEGTVRGAPFYFRSRGTRWSCEIAWPGSRSSFDGFRHGRDYGPFPSAGYLAEHEALTFLLESVRAYHAALRAR